jgi:thymidylate kinase
MSINLESLTSDKEKKPQLVEIVGPAGAGKTTLCNILSSCRSIHLSNFPDVRKVANAPFFILSGFRVLPIVLQMFRAPDRKLTRREFAWLSILSGWPNILQNELKRNEDVIILDQGPVYLLSEMSVFGPEFLKADRARQVWRAWYCQWASTLDAIVWLDAPDECLINRIRSRAKDHVVKDAAPQEVIKFLKSYRKVYERIFSELTIRRGDLNILQFDTSRQLPETIANQLLIELNLKIRRSVDQKC